MSGKLFSILSIAGSDNMGGAGIQADIKVGSSLGLHVLTAITTVTAQNSSGLLDSLSISPRLLKLQLEAILEDVMPDAVKIGMVGSVENIEIIADFLDIIPNYIPVVVDPVLYVSATRKSIKDITGYTVKLRDAYLERLFPKVTVVTPNLDELKMFTGKDSIDGDTLSLLKAKAAVIKGGHGNSDQIIDKLLLPGKELSVTHKKIKCRNLHGSGCVFSSYLASYMAMGNSIEIAFEKTCRKLNLIISKSADYNLGSSPYGPLNILEKYKSI